MEKSTNSFATVSLAKRPLYSKNFIQVSKELLLNPLIEFI